jgi:hypothetical protein
LTVSNVATISMTAALATDQKQTFVFSLFAHVSAQRPDIVEAILVPCTWVA